MVVGLGGASHLHICPLDLFYRSQEDNFLRCKVKKKTLCLDVFLVAA